MTPATPLDDVEFLARSAHRVQVLRTLSSGPRTRPDLHAETGVPQPTLGRVLGDFEDRNWVERQGREYALTSFGALVDDEFEELLETVETVQKLGDVVQQLPIEQMDFNLRELADATITTPEAGNVFGPVDRLTELFFGAERARILVHSAPPGTQEDHRNRAKSFQESDRQVESINSAETLDRALSNPETARLIREGLESDRVTIYKYDGTIPFVLAVADDTTMLAPTDEHGVPVALIETENENIRSWVETTLDEYRERSTEVTVDDCAP
jgi:predicted transcriptional regulator